jgi:hypothetical protein
METFFIEKNNWFFAAHNELKSVLQTFLGNLKSIIDYL